MARMTALFAAAVAALIQGGQGNAYETSLPQVYLIDYAADHVDSATYLETVSKAPPDILHLGHDVVFKSHLGACRGFGAFPATYELLSPEECDAEILRLRGYVDSLHRAGVKTVIPYICDVLLFGDHLERTGFWKFYDRWDEYERFGLGKKPATDPAEWLQRVRRDAFPEKGIYVYETCINQPDWQDYLRAVVRIVARCGYDGVFVDVNSFRCEKECCRAPFAKYLQDRFSQKWLEEHFGFTSTEDVRLGREGDGLLEVETFRFRAWSMARLFSVLEAEGASIEPGFLIVPNLSPMASIDAVRKRIGNGQDVGQWAEDVDWLMYEEMQQTWIFEPGTVSDCILQYKFAFANGIRGGMLLYHARDRDGIALAMAEAGAGGGGGLIQHRYDCPEVRARYHAFWDNNRGLFEGLHSQSQVGVCFSQSELYWRNLDHLRAVYRTRRHLSDEHVLFDFVVDRDFDLETLRRYRAVLLPSVDHIGEERMAALHDFVSTGGTLVVMGACGSYDESGQPRPANAFVSWASTAPVGEENAVFKVGKGHLVLASSLDTLIPPRPFELFALEEDEANDISVVQARARETPVEPHTPSPLLRLLTSCTENDFAVTEDNAPATVRVSAFAKGGREGGSLVVHLVNYSVPIHAEAQSGPPVAVEKIELDLPLLEGWRAASVEALEPGGASEALPFSQDGDRISVTVPRLEVYKVVHVRCGRS